MTIHLPEDLENKVRDEVVSGHFASEDALIAEAVRLLLRDRMDQQATHPSATVGNSGLGFIGALRDDAELLDQAVEHAMMVREERPWRLSPSE
jgi:Arc/MetJ-type ribon-helix-helix transcriptional regulator